MEPFTKVMELLMDARLQVIELHDCLHGFTEERGTGTATLELKLAVQLAYMEQEPLYVNFLDLKKAYDTMDRGRLMQVLKGYRVGPKMRALIQFFWDNA